MVAGNKADDQEIVTKGQEQERRIEHPHNERAEVAQLE
jgi:hypothetical protein